MGRRESVREGWEQDGPAALRREGKRHLPQELWVAGTTLLGPSAASVWPEQILT